MTNNYPVGHKVRKQAFFDPHGGGGSETRHDLGLCAGERTDRTKATYQQGLKHILLVCSLLATFFLSSANPVVYKQCVPNNGSTISSWDFTLEFDITDALSAAAISNPGVEVGLGVYANTTTQVTTLYKGSVEDNIVLGKTFTKTINGKSAEFVVNGNTVKMSFDSSIPIEKGQKYTIVIGNDMALYIKDKATRVASTLLKNNTNPIYLEFFGADLSDSQLFVEKCSIENGVQLETLNSLKFDLSSPFTISDEGCVYIKEGEDVVASTDKLTVSNDNPNQLITEFAEPVKLKFGVNYTIQIPEGTLIHKDNPNVSNIAFETSVTGASATYFGAISSSPLDGEKALPENAYIVFDIPAGNTLKPNSSQNPSGRTACAVFVKGDETKIFETKGSYCSNNKGFLWDLSSIEYEPSTTYYLKKDKGSIYVYDESGKHLPDYINDEVIVSWTTPSVEEVNLPLATGACYINPKLGKHDDEATPNFSNGGTYSHISIIEIELAKNTYQYNGKSYNAGRKSDVNWELYDVTSGKRVFIKEIRSTAVARETTYEYYSVGQLSVDADFIQGHTYEIVLPQNGLSVGALPSSLVNYVRSEEIVYRIIGSKPSSVNLLSKTICDNEEVGTLYTAGWVFEGDFTMSEDATVGLSMQLPNSSAVTYYWPLSAKTLSGKTYVSASFINEYDATPITFSDVAVCKFIFPAGILTYAGDNSISNKEIVTPFTGVPKLVESAETVNVTLDVNGVHSTSHSAVKGQPISFTLAHDNNWVVESVTHNGSNVASENGTYTTEPLNSDENNIEAKLKFAVESLVDGTTGVAQLPDSNITVFSEQQHVVISGLTGNETVSVYAMNGMLVNEHENKDYSDLRISVAPGIYVVLVVDAYGNRKAAKVKVD